MSRRGKGSTNGVAVPVPLLGEMMGNRTAVCDERTIDMLFIHPPQTIEIWREDSIQKRLNPKGSCLAEAHPLHLRPPEQLGARSR